MASGLPWFRVDSDIAGNPKIADMIADHGARGKAAAFVYIAAIGYCSAHLTDGVVRKGALALVHGTPADARLLVDAGLLAAVDGGWEVVNFAAHQPTRDQSERAAKARSEAARTAANARWSGKADA